MPTDAGAGASRAFSITRISPAFPPPPPLSRREDETAAAWKGRLTENQLTQIAEWRRDHSWHPYQLRHSYATKARKLFDLEHAGAALGHTRMSATEVYAERDSQLAAAVDVEGREKTTMWRELASGDTDNDLVTRHARCHRDRVPGRIIRENPSGPA